MHWHVESFYGRYACHSPRALPCCPTPRCPQVKGSCRLRTCSSCQNACVLPPSLRTFRQGLVRLGGGYALSFGDGLCLRFLPGGSGGGSPPVPFKQHDFGGSAFTLRESVDTEAVAAFLQVLGRSVRFMTSSFAWMYMNSALARRDTVLTSSVAPKASKASLSTLPLASGSLFSHQLEATIRSQTDRQRDVLALNVGSYSQSRKCIYPAAPPKRKSAVHGPSFRPPYTRGSGRGR